eukprot:COSAG01_NODE_3198_length_6430_cov_10.203759_1_plen_186_part_10
MRIDGDRGEKPPSMPRPEPAGVLAVFADGAPEAPQPPPPLSPWGRRRDVGAVVRWLTVTAIHTLAAIGLVWALHQLYFGRVEAECIDADLASCADDEGWRSSRFSATMPEGFRCTDFASSSAGGINATSAHDLCPVAKSEDGVLAADACKKVCGSCGWSKFIELFVASAPVWARNALLVALATAGC